MGYLLLLFLLVSLPAGGQEIERQLRVVAVGPSPIPKFDARNGAMTEFEPDPEDYQPTHLEIIGFQTRKKTTPRFSLLSNRIAAIPGYKGEAALGLKLLRPLAVEKIGAQEIHCALGNITHPLVIVTRDPGQQGWLAPLSRAINASPSAAPARSVVLVNLTRIPLRAKFGGKEGTVPAGGNALFQPSPFTGPLRYHVNAVAGNTSATLGNSAIIVPENSRLFAIVFPDPNARPAPAALRLLTDPVQMRATVPVPENRE